MAMALPSSIVAVFGEEIEVAVVEVDVETEVEVKAPRGGFFMMTSGSGTEAKVLGADVRRFLALE
jgi:hypothetical protein